MPPRPGTQRLRYHFDALPQLRAHLHPAEGRQLLFFPDPMGALHERQAVMLELCAGNVEQAINACGEVNGLEGGAFRGAWIEISSFSLHQLHSAHRKHRRIAADLLARVDRQSGGGMVLRLVDVSIGGARLAGAGFAFKPGDLVLLADLQGGPAAAGVVTWTRSGEMAVQFDRTRQQTRLGATRLLLAASERWDAALAARHPAGCECLANGRVLEPLLPRTAHRQAQAY